jgi:hypothetical protein
MPSGRSRSRSFSRGRAAKRYRSRSSSVGSAAYNVAARSRSASVARSAASRRRNISLNVHSFSRWGLATTLNFTGVATTNDFSFQFADILNAAEFSSLFDQFKIDYVKLNFQMITNPDSLYPTNSVSASTTINPTNYVRVDEKGSGSNAHTRSKPPDSAQRTHSLLVSSWLVPGGVDLGA